MLEPIQGHESPPSGMKELAVAPGALCFDCGQLQEFIETVRSPDGVITNLFACHDCRTIWLVDPFIRQLGDGIDGQDRV
jgi:hypothetical protein